MRKAAAAVIVVLSLAAIVRGLPAPTVSFRVNPDEGNKGSFFPSCFPLVLSLNDAFICYRDVQRVQGYAQQISPSGSAKQSPTIIEPYDTYVIRKPLPISAVAAMAFTSQASASYFAFMNATYASAAYTRMNSTAQCATDPVNSVAYVPYGVHFGVDILDAYDEKDISHSPANFQHMFEIVFDNEEAYNFDTLLHTPVYYQGSLLFIHNNTFYKYDGTTGSLQLKITDPCGVGPDKGQYMQLAVATFGEDTNGPLDAFLVYGNTTVSNRAQFDICRVSHNSGVMEWKWTYWDDVVVQDVSGGGSLIFVTGYALTTAPVNYVSLILDATNGNPYGIIRRSWDDEYSFPVALPKPITASCGAAIAMQVNGNLSAFCASDIRNYSLAPVWSVAYRCDFRPIADPLTNQIVCSSIAQFVSAFDADSGQPVWLDGSKVAVTQPVYYATNGVSYAFVTDWDSTLWGFKIAAPPSPPPPAPPQGESKGMTNGEVAALVICLLIAVGAAAGVAFLYLRRSKRREAYRPDNIQASEYGSLVH
jgi:hypothetical protein